MYRIRVWYRVNRVYPLSGMVRCLGRLLHRSKIQLSGGHATRVFSTPSANLKSLGSEIQRGRFPPRTRRVHSITKFTSDQKEGSISTAFNLTLATGPLELHEVYLVYKFRGKHPYGCMACRLVHTCSRLVNVHGPDRPNIAGDSGLQRASPATKFPCFLWVSGSLHAFTNTALIVLDQKGVHFCGGAGTSFGEKYLPCGRGYN